jgi:hypothetical protein
VQRVTSETYPSRPPDRISSKTQDESASWWPLDCLRPLGRAASIAAGVPWNWQAEYRGFRIVATGQDGAYCARITHHDGREIRLPAQIRHQVDQASFRSPEEAMQHARFVITLGALTPFLPR